MRTPHTVHVLPYVGTTENEYGNEVPTWGAPVAHRVYGWAPAGSVEVNGYRQTVTADLSLYAPHDFPVAAKDHVRVAGQTYDVEGLPDDFSHGPFGFAPGVVVNLKRLEAS